MAILGVYGEDICFPYGVAPTVTTNAAFFKSDRARCAIGQTWPTLGPGTRSKAFQGGAVTSCWFHYRLYHNDQGAHTNLRHAGLGKSGTNCGLWIGEGTLKVLRLTKYDGTTSTTLQDESGLSLTPNGFFTIDVCVTNFGASGNVKVYVNGAAGAVIDYTGDLTESGMTELDCVVVQGTNDYNQAWVSECIVMDIDTRTFSLGTLAGNASGDTNEWDGGDYTEIDEVVTNDSDLIYTDTTDETFLANVNDLPAGTYRILGVVRKARAVASADAGIGGLCLGVKSGGTVSVDIADAMSLNWETYEHIMDDNPVTAVAFTQAEITALQSALKSAT